MKSVFTRAVLAAAFALAVAPAAFAQLNRVGPVGPLGYPTWYQDKTGLTLEFCDNQTQPELAGGWCVLLPGDLPLGTAPERYEYTGSGYFLTVKHPGLPADRRTLSDPFVVGIAGDVRAGFVVFLGDGELTLECHTWGELDVPADFRQRQVNVSTAPTNVVDLRGQHWSSRPA